MMRTCRIIVIKGFLNLGVLFHETLSLHFNKLFKKVTLFLFNNPNNCRGNVIIGILYTTINFEFCLKGQ